MEINFLDETQAKKLNQLLALRMSCQMYKKTSLVNYFLRYQIEKSIDVELNRSNTFLLYF